MERFPNDQSELGFLRIVDGETLASLASRESWPRTAQFEPVGGPFDCNSMILLQAVQSNGEHRWIQLIGSTCLATNGERIEDFPVQLHDELKRLYQNAKLSGRVTTVTKSNMYQLFSQP